MSIAVITGANRGLGKSMALHLADKGLDIIVTYHSNKNEADDVIRQIQEKGRQALALPLDVSQSNTFRSFAAQVTHVLESTWGRQNFDILINNAGIGIEASYSETTEAQFDQLMAIHLKGPYFLTQALLPLLNDGGRIINISSGLARFSFPGYSAYATMKGGVEVMTRYMAKELGSRGISAIVVAPGAIETDFGGGKVRDDKQLNAIIASQTALGRVGQADDIGKAIAALATQDTQWINGQRIEASGGMLL